MTGTSVGYAAKRRQRRANRGEAAKMGKVYPSEEASRLKDGERSDYRRCLVWTVTDPELTQMGLPEIYIEENGGRRPVYSNPAKGRQGTYVLKNPNANGALRLDPTLSRDRTNLEPRSKSFTFADIGI